MVTEKSSNLFANLFVYTEKIDMMIKKKKNVLILCLCGKREVLWFFLSLSVTIKL